MTQRGVSACPRPSTRGEHSPASADVHARAGRRIEAHLIPGREDDQVDLVLDTVRHESLLCETLDPLAFGVDQIDVRLVERIEVKIAEAGSLAHVHVPRLQPRSRVPVLDGVRYATAEFFHLLVVSHLERNSGVFGETAGDQSPHAPGRADIGPGVTDQVLLSALTVNDVDEVFAAFVLPARFQRLPPLRIRLGVGAHINGGRRALDDK